MIAGAAARASQARRSLRLARLVAPRLRAQRRGSDAERIAGLVELTEATGAQLGGAWVKFAQLLSATDEGGRAPGLRRLLDDVGPVPVSDLRRVLRIELNERGEDLAAGLTEPPLGTASIAVVHRSVHEGATVAVKVLRPAIRSHLAADLWWIERAATRLAGSGPAAPLLGNLRRQLTLETDLRNEADVQIHARLVTAEAGLDRLVIPSVYSEMSTASVLTMDHLDGVAIDRLPPVGQRSGSHPLEPVIQLWFLTGLRYRYFHADLHAGNLMWLPDGRIGVLDWGVVHQMDERTHALLRNLLAGALGDNQAWERAVAGFMAASPIPFPEEVAEMMRVRLHCLFVRPPSTWPPQIPLSEVMGLAAARRVPTAAAPATGDVGVAMLAKQFRFIEHHARGLGVDRPLISDLDWWEALLDKVAAQPPAGVSSPEGDCTSGR